MVAKTIVDQRITYLYCIDIFCENVVLSYENLGIACENQWDVISTILNNISMIEIENR